MFSWNVPHIRQWCCEVCAGIGQLPSASSEMTGEITEGGTSWKLVCM